MKTTREIWGGGNPKHTEFRSILKKIDQRSNQRYWIYRTIILNNLFGVDIMPGAVETAKLRLFLKLAAEAEMDKNKANFGLDPLPDIDFNIRVGNSLIGFTNLEEIKRTQNLASNQELIEKIAKKASRIDDLHKKFISKQEETKGLHELHQGDEKEQLSKALTDLSDTLDKFLAENNGIQQKEESSKYQSWRERVKPFHWWSGFHNILQSGGFDVVIGNPPYKVVSQSKQEPELHLYKTTNCNNLYGFFIERCVKLGYQGMGMVVPISLPSTTQMSSVREQLTSPEVNLYLSHFTTDPVRLFHQVKQRITIFLAHKGGLGNFYSTHYNHWWQQEREFLFSRLAYCSDNSQRGQEIWGKVGSFLQKSIIEKVSKQDIDLEHYQIVKRGSEQTPQKMFSFNNSTFGYWGKFLLSHAPPARYKKIYFHSPEHAAALMAMMSSSLFFNCWTVFSDGRDVRNLDLRKLRINKKAFEKDFDKLAGLGKRLNKDLEKNKKRIDTKQAEFKYRIKLSKGIIDQIDTLIAKHYDLTPEELDYVINYLYKYRMGKEKNADRTNRTGGKTNADTLN